MADTRENATKAFDAFMETYQAKHPKACECLAKDRDELLVFYDFPAEHWKHLRTTNPIVHVRHDPPAAPTHQGNGTRRACLAMMFKLAQSAERRWRLLDGAKLLPEELTIALGDVRCRDKTAHC
jgi:hypothetical protein